MKVMLEKQPLNKTHTYFGKFLKKWSFDVVIRRMFIPYPRTVKISKKDKIIITLKEKTLFRRILLKTPINILSPYLIKDRSRYDIKLEQEIVGKIEHYVSPLKSIITINYKGLETKVFSTIYKKRVRFYFFHGQQQIGVVEDFHVTINGLDLIYGEFDDNTDTDLVMIFLSFIRAIEVRDLNFHLKMFGLENISRVYHYPWFTIKNRNLDVEFEHKNLDWHKKL